MIIKLENHTVKRIREFHDLRQAENSLPLVESVLGEKHYIHPVPQFPKWTDKNYKCQTHAVNLFLFKCTCDEFISDRAAQYDKSDIRICCRHLYYKLSNPRFLRYVDSLTLKLTYGTALKNERYFYKYIIYNQIVIFGFIPNSDWAGIYTRKRDGDFFRYSYNPIIKKWAEHLIPDQGIFIIDQFVKAIKYQLPYTHKLMKIQSIK